jgi:hypothetical protein
MVDRNNDALRDAAEAAAELVLGGYIEKWVEGAILPSEMAYYLAVCTEQGVSRVIESGRQDGYSTEILGDWAGRGDREVVSIDLEQDAARAALCRQRLTQLPLTLVKGSAYTEFGRWARKATNRHIGFLADGPKGWPAISMMAAATSDLVKVVALHNLTLVFRERGFFEDLGEQRVFYESALPNPGPHWQDLLARERKMLETARPTRPYDPSSLAVLVLNDGNRERFRRAWRLEFGLHQPAIVRTLWNAGAFGVATKLYGLSYRLLGR